MGDIASQVPHLGVPEMDMDHAHMSNIANELILLSGNQDCTEGELQARLAELRGYSATHFQAEERYMASINYPDRVEHMESHQELLVTLDDLFDGGCKLDEMRNVMKNFIDLWLLAHIKKHDATLAAFTGVTLEEIPDRRNAEMAVQVNRRTTHA